MTDVIKYFVSHTYIIVAVKTEFDSLEYTATLEDDPG